MWRGAAPGGVRRAAGGRRGRGRGGRRRAAGRQAAARGTVAGAGRGGSRRLPLAAPQHVPAPLATCRRLHRPAPALHSHAAYQRYAAWHCCGRPRPVRIGSSHACTLPTSSRTRCVGNGSFALWTLPACISVYDGHGLGRRRTHVPRPATPLLHALTARTHVRTALRAAMILLQLYRPVDLLLTIYITLLLQICIYQANPYSLSKWCHNVNARTFIPKTMLLCLVALNIVILSKILTECNKSSHYIVDAISACSLNILCIDNTSSK